MDLEKFGKCGDQLPNLEFLGRGCKWSLLRSAGGFLSRPSTAGAADVERNRLLGAAPPAFGEASQANPQLHG